MKAIHAAKEKEKLEDALNGSMPQNRMFTWDEIVSAESSFSEDLRIGIGAYGMVYKCTLHHTTVAVRILHSNGYHKSKQFQQVLEILSRLHQLFPFFTAQSNNLSSIAIRYLQTSYLVGNLISKIGDVGVSTILNSDDLFTMYKDAAPVGTLSHIDHENQRDGVISTKFDVYAFGLVILQLLTAKRACKVGISPTYKLMFRPYIYSM
ncbi:U-box domain-containing protein 35-like [Trifolium medium]|uniref:RING-type E3 ubiquitin transferase n=1 Tax=Trifolium medium TaxID=97028 RepID=A0A392NYM7_9FABA|nr:U-box domain-containing protein 35-like [Trifolium medium]